MSIAGKASNCIASNRHIEMLWAQLKVLAGNGHKKSRTSLDVLLFN